MMNAPCLCLVFLSAPEPPLPGAQRLREIFRLETGRTRGDDGVVRHENHFYQVEAPSRSHAPAKSKVTLCEWEDGMIEIHYRRRKLSWHEIVERPAKPEVVAKKRRPSTPAAAHIPNHPWRRSYQDMQALGWFNRTVGAPSLLNAALRRKGTLLLHQGGDISKNR